MPRCRPFPPLLAVLLGAACATTPPQEPEPERMLDTIDALVTARDFDQALALTEVLTDDLCPKRLRDRRDLLQASAHVGLGEHWDAFLALETFSDRYPHSDLRPQVIEMLWDIGRTLATSDHGFWIFWSDRRAGRTVLEHLITRHPDTQRLADALRLLGDMAYEDGNYELAQERYRDLMRRRPESEWVKYAGFRFAMSIVDSLQGSDYDLDKMNHAVRELTDFLMTAPENPALVTKAQAALGQLREWRAERHLAIAGFYRTVGNAPGRRYHLDIACSPEFEGTAAHDAALAQRSELGPAPSEGSSP